MFICLSVYLFIVLFVCLLGCLFVYFFISLCVFFCLFVNNVLCACVGCSRIETAKHQTKDVFPQSGRYVTQKDVSKLTDDLYV